MQNVWLRNVIVLVGVGMPLTIWAADKTLVSAQSVEQAASKLQAEINIIAKAIPPLQTQQATDKAQIAQLQQEILNLHQEVEQNQLKLTKQMQVLQNEITELSHRH